MAAFTGWQASLAACRCFLQGAPLGSVIWPVPEMHMVAWDLCSSWEERHQQGQCGTPTPGPWGTAPKQPSPSGVTWPGHSPVGRSWSHQQMQHGDPSRCRAAPPDHHQSSCRLCNVGLGSMAHMPPPHAPTATPCEVPVPPSGRGGA